MHEAALRAGVMVLSGAGWDVVPSDCLALHTVRRVTDPERLTIGGAAWWRSATWRRSCSA
ncbi:hypothetical protein BJF90_36185 [Pseudonocardia sp. CNS-004]|nr:hypothetical protein BJF90_36185 [Pseudonocardia sp. CNS-004]